MIKDFVIRAMVREDLLTVGAIADATELFPSAMLADMAAPYLDHSAAHDWSVVEHGADIVGFAYCEPERATGGTFNMLAIAVRPDWQGRGAGAALMGALEDRLRQAGARMLLVETSSLAAYERTRAVYRHLGYEEEATVRDYYDTGDSKIIFRKAL